MSTTTYSIKEWLKVQKPRKKCSGFPVYDYFDFAAKIDTTEAITNLSFYRALKLAEIHDHTHRKEISTAYKSMTQRHNSACKFGRQYQTYWEDVSAYHIKKRKEVTAEDIVNMTSDAMTKTAQEIAGQISKRVRLNIQTERILPCQSTLDHRQKLSIQSFLEETWDR